MNLVSIIWKHHVKYIKISTNMLSVVLMMLDIGFQIGIDRENKKAFSYIMVKPLASH